MSKKVRLPDDSDLPDISVFGEHEHVAAFLVYVDDFLAAGPREILQPLLARLLDVWKCRMGGGLVQPRPRRLPLGNGPQAVMRLFGIMCWRTVPLYLVRVLVSVLSLGWQSLFAVLFVIRTG